MGLDYVCVGVLDCGLGNLRTSLCQFKLVLIEAN